MVAERADTSPRIDQVPIWGGQRPLRGRSARTSWRSMHGERSPPTEGGGSSSVLADASLDLEPLRHRGVVVIGVVVFVTGIAEDGEIRLGRGGGDVRATRPLGGAVEPLRAPAPLVSVVAPDRYSSIWNTDGESTSRPRVVAAVAAGRARVSSRIRRSSSSRNRFSMVAGSIQRSSSTFTSSVPWSWVCGVAQYGQISQRRSIRRPQLSQSSRSWVLQCGQSRQSSSMK